MRTGATSPFASRGKMVTLRLLGSPTMISLLIGDRVRANELGSLSLNDA
jgi:hypothetical protein